MHIEYRNHLEPGQPEILVHELLVTAFGPEELGESEDLIAQLQAGQFQVFSAWEGALTPGSRLVPAALSGRGWRVL